MILILAPQVTDPCNPSPCGPNSRCRQSNGHATCSCITGYIGSPPSCRPECAVSSDCPLNEACSNQKCRDPCLGTCGLQATCNVINHNPICSCASTMTGDPFIQCQIIRKPHQNLKFPLFDHWNLIIQSKIIFLKLKDHQCQLIHANHHLVVQMPSAG